MTQRERVHVALLGGLVGRRSGAGRSPAPRGPPAGPPSSSRSWPCASGHRLVRDQVVDALWPHLDPDAGAANLRKAAHHARQALGREDAVRLSGGLVALFPCVRGRHRRRGVRASRRGGDPRRATAAAVRRRRPYPGELLPDWLYEEWTQARRDRLRALHVELLRLGGRWERLARGRAGRRGGPPRAHARRAGPRRPARRDPLVRPAAHDSGARARPAAVAAEPRAVRGVRRRPRPGRDRRSSAGRPSSPAVAAALRAAERGELGALVVRGPAGIGKTTLCRRGRGGGAANAGGWWSRWPPRPRGTPTRRSWRPSSSCCSRDRSLLDAAPRRGALRRSPSSRRWPRRRPPHDGGLTRHMVIGAVHRLIDGVPGRRRRAAGRRRRAPGRRRDGGAWGQLARAGGAPVPRRRSPSAPRPPRRR